MIFFYVNKKRIIYIEEVISVSKMVAHAHIKHLYKNDHATYTHIDRLASRLCSPILEHSHHPLGLSSSVQK